MRDPRRTGYVFPAEDPKLTHDGPDEPRMSSAEWAEWHRAKAAADAAFDRGLARTLLSMGVDEREQVLASQPPSWRDRLEALMAEVGQREAS